MQCRRNSSYLEQTWPAWPQLAPTADVPSSSKLQGFRQEVRTTAWYCCDVPRFADCKIPTSTSGRPAQVPFLDYRLHHHLQSDSANRYGQRSSRALLRRQYCLQRAWQKLEGLDKRPHIFAGLACHCFPIDHCMKIPSSQLLFRIQRGYRLCIAYALLSAPLHRMHAFSLLLEVSNKAPCAFTGRQQHFR